MQTLQTCDQLSGVCHSGRVRVRCRAAMRHGAVQSEKLQRVGRGKTRKVEMMLFDEVARRFEEEKDEDMIPVERYRIILKHELVEASDRMPIEIEQPMVIQYVVPFQSGVQRTILINNMMDQLKDQLLRMVGRE